MSPEELFRNLMVMAAADGQMTEEEAAFLSQRARRWGITEQQFADSMVFSVSKDAVVSIPESHLERRQLLTEMVRMMAADGELAEIEKNLFAVAAGTMQIGSQEVNQIIDDALKST
jgi:uncharacterized tellurite resistance protein B-like protein